MRGCGTSIGTARLQRTRAITRNTHPMCSIGRAMITNFHDTFVLRDVTRRKRALFCNAPPTPQFIFLNRNGNPSFFSIFSFSFFSYILQGNAISIFNPGNFLKNCNCLECIKSLKFLFFLTSKEMELEWRFLLFLVNSLFRVRILCKFGSIESKDFLTKDTKIQITSGCNNGYRLWKKRIYSTRIVRIGSDLSIRDKKNCSRFSWRERTSWNK